MKKLILASAILAAFVGNVAHAAEAAPEHAVAYNVGAVSDYRFRGLSQSRLQPAVYAGVDYTHNPSGLYLGAWTSTIKWVKDLGGDGSYEVDIYGGKRGEVSAVAYDLGVIHYAYPGNKLGSVAGFADANTTEVYLQLGYGPAYVKYSQSLTNFVGNVNSKNSKYIDIGANIDVKDGYILNLHYGKQDVAGSTSYDYADWKIGVTKDLGFAVGAIAVVGTDALNDAATGYNWGGKFVGKTGALVSLTKSF